MPGARTVYDWMDEQPDVSAAIARARVVGFDKIAADGLAIVDDKEEDPASRRVRSEYRLKLLAKWDPKRYGERIEQHHSGSIGVSSALDALPDD